jgi:hypothetical protein
MVIVVRMGYLPIIRGFKSIDHYIPFAQLYMFISNLSIFWGIIAVSSPFEHYMDAVLERKWSHCYDSEGSLGKAEPLRFNQAACNRNATCVILHVFFLFFNSLPEAERVINGFTILFFGGSYEIQSIVDHACGPDRR